MLCTDCHMTRSCLLPHEHCWFYWHECTWLSDLPKQCQGWRSQARGESQEKISGKSPKGSGLQPEATVHPWDRNYATESPWARSRKVCGITALQPSPHSADQLQATSKVSQRCWPLKVKLTAAWRVHRNSRKGSGQTLMPSAPGAFATYHEKTLSGRVKGPPGSTPSTTEGSGMSPTTTTSEWHGAWPDVLILPSLRVSSQERVAS